MLGQTMTVTVNSVAKVLRLINQDSFSSEYLLKEVAGEYRARVRHSSEKALVSGLPMDRHNVELTHTCYPTEGVPTGMVRQAYIVLRNARSDTAAELDYLSDALADWVKANAVALHGWES